MQVYKPDLIWCTHTHTQSHTYMQSHTTRARTHTHTHTHTRDSVNSPQDHLHVFVTVCLVLVEVGPSAGHILTPVTKLPVCAEPGLITHCQGTKDLSLLYWFKNPKKNKGATSKKRPESVSLHTESTQQFCNSFILVFTIVLPRCMMLHALRMAYFQHTTCNWWHTFHIYMKSRGLRTHVRLLTYMVPQQCAPRLDCPAPQLDCPWPRLDCLLLH